VAIQHPLDQANGGKIFPQTANPITGSHAAGICRSSRQRIVMGRSPSWLS